MKTPRKAPAVIWEIYAQQALISPNAAAVASCPTGNTLTYRGVVERCETLARSLWNVQQGRECSCGAGLVVAIFVDRTHLDFLPLLLAVGRCHWTFVLLSTDLPDRERQKARNEFLLQAVKPQLAVVGCSLEVAEIELGARVPFVITSDALDQQGTDQLSSPCSSAASQAELMAFMCTGGSQRLKIVKVTHQMMISEQGAYAQLAPEVSAPRVLQHHRSFWPAAVLGQLSLAVALQGTSVHCSIESHELRDTVLREEIQVVGLVPDQLHLLLEDVPASLQLVLSWAERLPRFLAQRWCNAAPRCRLVEVLIATEYWLSFAGAVLSDAPSLPGLCRTILQPVSDVRYVVLNEEGQACEAGGSGELCLAGPMVTPGYLSDDDNSWILVDGKRFFRTGDLVQQKTGGFVYQGRKDRLTKWEGQWLDVALLEQRIQDLDRVKEACVIESEGCFDAFLVLDCCRAADLLCTMETLQKVRQMIPWYGCVKILPKLPRNENGKMDLKTLKASQQNTSEDVENHPNSDAARLWSTCRQHGSLAFLALLVSLCGETLAGRLFQASRHAERSSGGSSRTFRWLGPVSMAYAWLALAHGSEKTKWHILGKTPVPFSRMGFLLVLHVVPSPAARLLRRLLALLGLCLAPSHRMAWPLVFWFGIGTSLHYERVSCFRRGMLSGVLRHLQWSSDWLDEVLRTLAKRWGKDRRWNWRDARMVATRSTATQWEEYPKNEADLLANDRWVAGTLKESWSWKETSSAQETRKPEFEEHETTDACVVVRFSRSASVWALQTFAHSSASSDKTKTCFGRMAETSPTTTATGPTATEGVILEKLQHAVPGLDLDAPLCLDSLRVTHLVNTLRGYCSELRHDTVRQASSLRSLAAAAAVSASQKDLEIRMAPAQEYAIWYTPGQFQAMGPWLCRGRDVNVEHMRYAVALLQQRHPALRVQCSDPMSLRSFTLNCGVLHSAVGKALAARQPRHVAMWRFLGRQLLKAWPKVHVPGNRILTPDDIENAPFFVVNVYGQTELEKLLQNRMMQPPLEVFLLRLKLPVEGIWDCPGGHISIFRDGEDLVYFDPQLHISVKLTAPPAAELRHFLLHGTATPRGGEVLLRFPTSSELHVAFRFWPEEGLRSFSASRLPQEQDHLATFCFLVIQCYHSIADGYCISPIASDLFGVYDALQRGAEEREIMAFAYSNQDGVANALGVLERRLEETLTMGSDPTRHSLRGNLWSAWFNGSSSSLSIEGDTLAVLKAVAQKFLIPINYLLFAIVIVAKARASRIDAVEMTMYVPMRDGPESGMVGLFADWRDIRVATPDDCSLLAVLMELSDILRLRKWKVFNALRKAERTVVNFDLSDPREHPNGFCQVPETFWRSEKSKSAKGPWNHWEWLHQPLQFDLVEEHSQRWCIFVRVSEQYTATWRRKLLQALQDASYDMVFQPWLSVHRSFASDV